MSLAVGEVIEALNDSKRRELFTALLQDELCGKELKKLLNMSDSELTGHLEVLRENRLIEERDTEACTFYRARSNPLEIAREIVRERESQNWRRLRNKLTEIKREDICSLYDSRQSPQVSIT